MSSGVNLKDERHQSDSLIVSVPLSSATTVPGIQLPINNTNNSSTVSTIVSNQPQVMQNSSSTMSLAVSTSSVSSHGSLYKHLTNNQTQRIQPGMSRSNSPPNPVNSLGSDVHSNHTSVLQNMSSSGTGSVISSVAFQSSSTNISDTSPTILKSPYEKPPASRIHAIQQEETGRRSRYA
jgi:hypothetical protein